MNCSSLTLLGKKCKQKAMAGGDGKCEMHAHQLCTICQEETRRTDKKLACKHIFHPNCINEWFVTNIDCPTCRMEQDNDPYVVFRRKVEDNIRLRYKDAIKSLETELAEARRRH